MLTNDIYNKDELSALITKELKSNGIAVKYRKQKIKNEAKSNRIFRTHLHQLELTDVVLANGCIVQIPKFVSVACQRILEQVDTEGVFRKAGSTLRQKEIRASLEIGVPLSKSHNVIDVANLLKSFFRELPEPMLPPSLQEGLIRSLLKTKGQTEAILLTCLLLPELTVNTLAFFMQFLHTVSLSSYENKMSISNLAIIFTPGLMPTPATDIQGIRLNNHVKIVELLINHSNNVGVVPEKVVKKLNLPSSSTTALGGGGGAKSTNDLTIDKKKKRRSGSLTRMFNGFKKIVGKSSSENLVDESPTKNNEMIVGTPCLTKSVKKRKLVETAFSAKKKKDLLGLLPDGILLPNTPICNKKSKKSRLSLGGRRNLKYPSLTHNPVVSPTTTTVERRWSIVGSGWSRKKIQNQTANKKEQTLLKPLSPVVSLPCISDIGFPKIDYDDDLQNTNQNAFTSISSSSNSTTTTLTDDSSKTIDSEFVRIPKSEYEAIKERVSSIEKRISQEFGNVQTSLLFSSPIDQRQESLPLPSVIVNIDPLSGPERVKNKFERTCEETIGMNRCPSTDQLAKRLGRELKIRRSIESRIIRSPSARKIGSIRRRSRETVKLTRNATWHISSSKNNMLNRRDSLLDSEFSQNIVCNTRTSFYPKPNLKRGRPNTIQTGLQNRPNSSQLSASAEHNTESEDLKIMMTDSEILEEVWTSGEDFFQNNFLSNNSSITNQDKDSLLFVTPKTTKRMSRNKSVTPITNSSINIPINDANTKTPMLPPKSIPRRNVNLITPISGGNKSVTKQTAISNLLHRYPLTPLDECQQGRASIARLRTLNAGMVMAKAKLFDDLGNETEQQANCPPQLPLKSIGIENRRRSNRFVINKFETTNVLSKNSVPNGLLNHKRESENRNSKRESENRNSNINSGASKSRTPRRKNQQKSPGFVKKRSIASSTKYPDRKLFSNIVETAEVIVKPHSLKNFNKLDRSLMQSPRTDPKNPKIKKTLMVHSPRRFMKTPTNDGKYHNLRTPLKATPIAIRNSPRLLGKHLAI